MAGVPVSGIIHDDPKVFATVQLMLCVPAPLGRNIIHADDSVS